MLRILILGGHGFMGRALAYHWRQAGECVFAPTRDQAQVDDETALKHAMIEACPDVIVNLAALSSPLHEDARELYEVNAFGHLRVLECALSFAPTARVVLASSGNVYGQGVRPSAETDLPAPVNHYAISKLMGEQFNRLYAHRLRVCAVRPFNCVGRSQKASLVVSKLVAAFRRKVPSIELGNVSVERDYVDIRDVCGMWDAVLAAQDMPAIVNFGSGTATPLRVVIEILRGLSGHDMKILRSQGLMRTSDITYQCADTQLLSSLGFKPRFSLEETLSWMMSDSGEGQ